MNLSSNIHKLEASFWETWIRALSNSSFLRNVVRKGYYLVKEKETLLLVGLVVAWTAAGLTVGYFMNAQGLH